MPPIYEYSCPKCHTLQEHIHKMSESPQFTCCGESMVKVISSPAGFNLKGEGFYKNDYKDKPS